MTDELEQAVLRHIKGESTPDDLEILAFAFVLYWKGRKKKDAVAATLHARIATELRKWWSFDSGQQHTHTWHSREDFIDDVLPKLLEGK